MISGASHRLGCGHDHGSPTRPRRSADRGRLSGAPVPRRAVLVRRRVRRRGHVLLSLGVPGHQRADDRAPGHRLPARGPLLLPSRAEAAPGGCRRGDRDLPDVHAGLVGRAPGLDRRRRGQRPPLLRELPLPLRVRRLLRRRHRQEPVPALLVALDRGAVLRRLPGAAAGALPRGEVAATLRRAGRAGRPCSSSRWPPRSGSRPATSTARTTAPTPGCTSCWPGRC